MAAATERLAVHCRAATIGDRRVVVRLHTITTAAASAAPARLRERLAPELRLPGARAARVALPAPAAPVEQTPAGEARPAHQLSVSGI